MNNKEELKKLFKKKKFELEKVEEEIFSLISEKCDTILDVFEFVEKQEVLKEKRKAKAYEAFFNRNINKIRCFFDDSVWKVVPAGVKLTLEKNEDFIFYEDHDFYGTYCKVFYTIDNDYFAKDVLFRLSDYNYKEFNSKEEADLWIEIQKL